MSGVLIKGRSIIPSCDVDSLEKLRVLIEGTKDVVGISAYKLGFELGLRFGLPRVVDLIRNELGAKQMLIYDHQKAGTDIPDTGVNFARALSSAGIDVAILFPQAGPVTQSAWIRACRDEGLGLMVGGIMTHRSYSRSDGGYLDDDATFEIYSNACKEGIRDFVVPGTKLDIVSAVRTYLSDFTDEELSFYAPGFLVQGGSIGDFSKVAGSNWHAIVGRAFIASSDVKAKALELCGCLG